jgi:uncharacterized protein (DUF302 family)
MKKLVQYAVTAAAAALFAGTVAVPAEAGIAGLVTMPSHHTVSVTIDRLESGLKAKGMTIFARIDHSAGAARDGLKLPPTQLLIFGNPKGGTPLMQASPVAGIDLPMKALAWTGRNGKVWLSYDTASYIASRDHVRGKGKLVAKLDRFLKTEMRAAAK